MQENKIDYEDGLTSTQLQWMQTVQAEATQSGHEHTFIFTHAPIVGHGGEASSIYTENRKAFVEWANGDDSDYPSGGNIRAVFAGHKHKNNIFHSVHTDMEVEGHMNKPKEKDNPERFHTLEYFSPDGTVPHDEAPYYIESTNSA